MDDLTVDYVRITDTHRLQRDSTTQAFRTYEFFIGKHGPFVEHVPAGPDVEQELRRRVEALKLHLATLPR